MSGTAIKAVVAYISDYITKPGLKTYSIFEAIKGVFNLNSQLLGGTMKRKEKARHLITQIVNALTSKMEIGGPMASLYLLGNPDHYTSHVFVPIYWRQYVKEALKPWNAEVQVDVDMGDTEKVMLQHVQNHYVGVSSVHDYLYRPTAYEGVTLYEWSKKPKESSNPHHNSNH